MGSESCHDRILDRISATKRTTSFASFFAATCAITIVVITFDATLALLYDLAYYLHVAVSIFAFNR